MQVALAYTLLFTCSLQTYVMILRLYYNQIPLKNQIINDKETIVKSSFYSNPAA